MNIRKLIAFSFLTLASVGFNAQVEIDKPVQLTGADGDRRVTNLETPVDGSDAANKDYVDAQVASVSGGTSNLDFTISANTADVYLAPGLSNSATPLVLSLAYVSGVPAPVGGQRPVGAVLRSGDQAVGRPMRTCGAPASRTAVSTSK